MISDVEERVCDTSSRVSQTDSDDCLFPGSSITRQCYSSLAWAFCLKHSLTAVAVEDLIELINTAIPNALPATPYLFKKNRLDSIEYSTNFVCPHCFAYVGETLPENGLCVDCSGQLDIKMLQRTSSYFLSLSVADQLSQLLENEHVCYCHPKQTTTFSIPPADISLSCNIDGVPVFKSSKVSMWPVLLSVNEVPFNKRTETMILKSLWFASSKPRIDSYLRPLIEELKILQADGVQWKDAHGNILTTKCTLTMCICDSVARPMVQNVIQFNGLYGCSYCKHKGEMIKKGSGHVRVYPADSGLHPPRTKDESLEHAKLALKDGKPHFGIKGPCVLSELPQFNSVTGFPPDYMHCVCLGVVRQVVDILVDSVNHAQPFYLGDCIEEIDGYLLQQKPPNEIHRSPRSLSLRKYWKASEWRCFLLFYSVVVFKKLMKAKYFHHWLLLVNGIHVLLSTSVNQDTINYANRCLVKFVAQFHHLYGKINTSFNVHLLIHLSESVRIFGCLQKQSAFVYEDACGRLLRLFHGTQGVPKQIVKNFRAQQNLLSFLKAPEEAERVANVDLFHQMHSRIKLTTKAVRLGYGCVAFGPPRKYCLTVEDTRAIEQFAHESCTSVTVEDTVVTYERFTYDNHMYTSYTYCLSRKRNNSVVQLKSGVFGQIRRLVVLGTSGDPFVLIDIFRIKRSRYVDSFVGSSVTDFMHYVSQSDVIVACRPDNLKSKCVMLTDESDKLIINLPPFECD